MLRQLAGDPLGLGPAGEWGPARLVIGWLIGALRLMPNFEPTVAGHTIIPNPFWGGVLFPLVVFGVMFASDLT